MRVGDMDSATPLTGDRLPANKLDTGEETGTTGVLLLLLRVSVGALLVAVEMSLRMLGGARVAVNGSSRGDMGVAPLLPLLAASGMVVLQAGTSCTAGRCTCTVERMAGEKECSGRAVDDASTLLR